MKKAKKGADVMNAINQLKGDVQSHVRSSRESVAKEVAENIWIRADDYVPEDTGDLRASAEIVRNDDGNYTVKYTDWKAMRLEFNIPTEEPYDGRNGPADFGLPGNKKGYTKPGTGPLYLTRATDEEANENKVVQYLRDSLGRFRKRKSY